MPTRTDADWHSLLAAATPAIISSASTSPPIPAPQLAKTIDHTLLAPAATPAAIAATCEQALSHRFASVCVNTVHARHVSSLLTDSDVATCCVVGFPLGAMSPEAKAFEAATAIAQGAQEIDTVISIGLLKAGLYSLVRADIAGVVIAAAPHPVKVIIETALLTDEEKVAACILAADAGAAFVKTCTGFSGGVASVGDVKLMRRAVEGYSWKGEGWEGRVRVKASGGVRTREACVAMLEAGADRIGTSSGVALMHGGEGVGY